MTKKDVVGLDIELTPNWFLVTFYNFRTKKWAQFEMFEGHPLDISAIQKILESRTIVTFNGNAFDIPLLFLAMRKGITNKELKNASDAIIAQGLKPWRTIEKFKLNIPRSLDHIDLIDVAPGKASLKLYGGRIHCKKMQDMPFDHTAHIDEQGRGLVRDYNLNDLYLTKALYERLLPQINLRISLSDTYGVDLRSKSDAQIAEIVITKSVAKFVRNIRRPNIESGTEFQCEVPPYVTFKTKPLQEVLAMVLNATFTVPDTGHVAMPKQLAEATITIGKSTYQLGIGGLHSTEQSFFHLADSHTLLVDRDVTSYYPTIILNQGLTPSHLGESFTHTYRKILEQRVAAKHSGNKVVADSLKITVNGSFGKFGNKYSNLYAPELMIRTTITGQLSLLMLIEALESEGISVVSANTDGVVIKCPVNKAALMEFIVWEWETKTGFETEATHYKALYSRDVNSYVAVLTDGRVKRKGAYGPGSLQKNPTNEICTDAVISYLRDGQAVEETITTETDIRKFITVRTVAGGALKDQDYLGRAIRWYYARGVKGVIRYKLNGHTVPRTEGAKPLMELPDSLPEDVDFDWYITEAKSLLVNLGVRDSVGELCVSE
jgi:DNA polymerase elongation subunit (family B)